VSAVLARWSEEDWRFFTSEIAKDTGFGAEQVSVIVEASRRIGEDAAFAERVVRAMGAVPAAEFRPNLCVAFAHALECG